MLPNSLFLTEKGTEISSHVYAPTNLDCKQCELNVTSEK